MGRSGNPAQAGWWRAPPLPRPRPALAGLPPPVGGIRSSAAISHCPRPLLCYSACGRWPFAGPGGGPALNSNVRNGWIADIGLGMLRAMKEDQNSWLAAAVVALAPGEQGTLADAAPGETVVGHLIRIARRSRRAQARRAAMGALFPAARDRLPGVVELAVDLIHDASQAVRYEACRALAIALDRGALSSLRAALKEGVDVPWDGLARAIRAVEKGNRRYFQDHPDTGWVLQDEEIDLQDYSIKIVGSAAYGTGRP